MSDDKDQVYGPERAERLVAMLRAIAERIQTLDRAGQLLDRVAELQKLLGTRGANCSTTKYGSPTTRRRSRRAGASWRRRRGATTTKTTNSGGGVATYEGVLRAARGRGGGRWWGDLVRFARHTGGRPRRERAAAPPRDRRLPRLHAR